ncbi:MAG TPA: single-stranded DNA-binding protein [Methylomirabilota bacterium]|nr:single-stranded DNA-binding protein [Methylomirabilota bacterium]
MRGYNKVILMGNLTRDPELRYTPKGTAVAKIGLAVNRTWRDAETNEMKEEVTFVDVSAFGRQAETIGQYLRKGRPLMVEGRLKLDTWEDKNTHEKKSKLGVVLESFQFLDSGSRGEGGDGEGGAAPARSAASAPFRRAAPAQPAAQGFSSNAEPDVIPPEDDDVPF